jgi:hypothetical protein
VGEPTEEGKVEEEPDNAAVVNPHEEIFLCSFKE